MPAACRLNVGRTGSGGYGLGSGQFGTPWECMHRAKCSIWLHHWCSAAGLSSMLPVFGSRCWQAFRAVWSWELLTLSCCAVSLGTPPLPLGSGKFGTPCERMQLEKATAERELADPPAFDEPPEPVADGPPHPATRARPAVTMMAAAVRAVLGFMPAVL